MTASEIPPAAAPASRGRGLHITLWVVQILMAVFLLAAAAGPKLVGEQTAVEMFTVIGIGQWFRYLVGLIELAGAVGLLIPRLAGLAALCLAVFMVFAAITQAFVLDGGLLTITPILLGVISALIAWGRWPQTKALAGMLAR